MHPYQTRLNRRGAALWMLCGLASPALAGTGEGADLPAPETAGLQHVLPAQAGEPLIDVDIPAQSLESALQRYGSLSHQPALFRAEIVDGRTAAAVHGRYTPEMALRLLLEGTGLTAEKFSTGTGSAFILKTSDSMSAPARNNELGELSGYPGRVQSRIWQALCGNPRTVPGSYRSLLRFRVDAAGRVRQARLIGSSGDTRRDAAMLAILQDVQIDGAPPPDMPQPVTMLLLPREAGFGLHCVPATSGGASHAAAGGR